MPTQFRLRLIYINVRFNGVYCQDGDICELKTNFYTHQVGASFPLLAIETDNVMYS